MTIPQDGIERENNLPQEGKRFLRKVLFLRHLPRWCTGIGINPVDS
jgi:hypothetical protein